VVEKTLLLPGLEAFVQGTATDPKPIFVVMSVNFCKTSLAGAAFCPTRNRASGRRQAVLVK
jgi:hypothetical protein